MKRMAPNVLILFVVWWTARAARNKGHNMLVWATLAAIPAVGLFPGFPDGLTALCMFPMLALMFVPARRRSTPRMRTIHRSLPKMSTRP